jgi:outer membrane receptor protein involved in Fe transport
VDAFDAGLIEQAGITSMRDYVGMAPQISVVETQNIGFTFVNVRGLSQVRNSEPTVAMVVDGVLQTTGLGFSEELYDIEQVEVLKGPQGALYGRNASGGAINVTTRQPTNQFEAFARAGFGNGENMAFTGSLSGALVRDTLMGRAAVSIKDAEGWRTNITTGPQGRRVQRSIVPRPAAVAAAFDGDGRPALRLLEDRGAAVAVRSNAPNFVMARRPAACRASPPPSAAGATAPRRCCRACRPRSRPWSAIPTTPASASRATSPASTIAR